VSVIQGSPLPLPQSGRTGGPSAFHAYQEHDTVALQLLCSLVSLRDLALPFGNQLDGLRVAMSIGAFQMASTSNYGGQDTLGKAKQTLDDGSDRIMEAASDAAQHVQDVAGNVQRAINKSVKDGPLTTLMMAGAVGFVLGALWKS
jgi:ElaB/YqjD/DUF883 family membrane-anchored ribosome-binding protein